MMRSNENIRWSDAADGRRGRAGMTLLEVLVALGILVAGLASVAALMPAAGSRLADATAIDRAGTLSANAHADLRNRGKITAALFPNDTTKIVMLGKVAALDQTTDPFAAAPFGKDTTLPQTAWTLQDDLQLGPSNTPVANDGGVCFGATVIPTLPGAPAAAGSRARVAVVVFKKQPVESQQVALTKVAGGVFRLSGSGADPESLRKRFFPACSWAFAVDATTPELSRWLHVGSSWTTNGVSYVSFSNADAYIVTSIAVNGTLTVYGFTRVLRVDEQPAILK